MPSDREQAKPVGRGLERTVPAVPHDTEAAETVVIGDAQRGRPPTEPEVAVMVEEPAPRPVATPTALMVATARFDEVQVTEALRFAVVPSVKVPVAVNGSVVPSTMLGLAGVTAIEVTTAAVTVSVVVPLTLPAVAVMVDEPVASVEASPVVIVATARLDEVQVAELVRSCVEPSVKVPVAVNG